MSTTLKPLYAALTMAGTLLLQAPAQADIAEVVTGDGQTMTFEYDANNLRMNLPEGNPGYMLRQQDKIYVVTQQGGRTMVFDLASAIQMFGDMAAGATPAAVDAKVISLDATGKKETLGGLEGEVYQLEFVDHEGTRRSTDMVLSKAPLALTFRDSIFGLTEVMSRAIDKSTYQDELEATQEMQAKLEELNLGVLRYGQDLKIQSISDTAVAAERFVLPAQPIDIGAMINAMGGSGGLGQMLGGNQLQDQGAGAATEGKSAAELLGEAMQNMGKNQN